MALLLLWNDLTTLRFVSGFGATEDFVLPVLKQEDIYDITYQAVVPSGNPLAPHKFVNLAGYSLTISVGTDGSPLAQQATFTPSADNLSLRGSLSLNTAGIAALTSGQAVTFEAQLSNGSTGVHRTQQNVTVKKSVNIASALAPIAGDSALGRIEGQRLFVKRQGDAGEAFILVSQDGTKSGIIYWDNDGSFRAEPIT